MLRLFFCPEKIAAVDDRFNEVVSISDALSSFKEFDLVTGHSEILSAAGTDAFKIAIFRDPFTRLLSERRQWMQARSENIDAAPARVAEATTALQHRSMVDILRSVVDYPVMMSSFWNHQALTLGAWPILRTEGRLQRSQAYRFDNMHEHFESGTALRAWLVDNKARIAKGAFRALKDLDYVGLTEDFDASVREIFARIGFPEPDKVVVRNARSAFDDEGNPELAQIAAEFLELDNELYAAAVERHAAFDRAARGSPADYLGRELSEAAPLVVSSREAPGGHGWYGSHQSQGGTWHRWSGPGLESRFALSAPPGLYRMDIEIFGAVSERSIREMRLEVEGRQLETRVARLPADVWVVTALLERTRIGRFDIVFRFPDLGLEHGIELKQISFISLPPTLRGKVAFEEAARALRALGGTAAKERDIAVLFGAAIRDFVQWLDLPDLERWRAEDPACRTAGDIFAAVAEVTAAASALAVRRGMKAPVWQAQSQEHASYALARLGEVNVPAAFLPLRRVDEPFKPATRAFDAMVLEAAQNLVEVLKRTGEEFERAPGTED
jgi:hypothetical protein